MIETSKRLPLWRQDVRQAALVAMDNAPTWDRDAAGLVLHATFTLPRPKGHYRAGKQTSHLLRDGAPRWPAGTPDLDKLLRAVGDALTSSGVYADDSRVVAVHGRKAYPSTSVQWPGVLDRPGAVLVLEPAR